MEELSRLPEFAQARTRRFHLLHPHSEDDRPARPLVSKAGITSGSAVAKAVSTFQLRAADKTGTPSDGVRLAEPLHNFLPCPFVAPCRWRPISSARRHRVVRANLVGVDCALILSLRYISIKPIDLSDLHLPDK